MKKKSRIVRVEDMRNTQKIVVGKSEGTDLLGDLGLSGG